VGNLACFVTADLANTKLRMFGDCISRGIAGSRLLKVIRGNSRSSGTVDWALVDFLYGICVRDDGIRRVLSYGHPLHSSRRGQPDPVPMARHDHCTWRGLRGLPPQSALHRGHCAGLCWGSGHFPRRYPHTLLCGNRPRATAAPTSRARSRRSRLPEWCGRGGPGSAP